MALAVTTAFALQIWAAIALQALAAQAVAWVAAAREDARQNSDRGDALSTVVMTVGLVLLAGFLLLQLRTKGQTIVNNVCTNADPSTC